MLELDVLPEALRKQAVEIGQVLRMDMYPSDVNGSLKCSDFGNFKCSVFGSNTTVDYVFRTIPVQCSGDTRSLL